jgi:hypothetical protein
MPIRGTFVTRQQRKKEGMKVLKNKRKKEGKKE